VTLMAWSASGLRNGMTWTATIRRFFRPTKVIFAANRPAGWHRSRSRDARSSG
jgi:hypothetical protein